MKVIKIIIVEDEPAILQGIERLISRIELPLSIVGSYTKGQEALDNLAQVQPDIVMTDVQMPVMSGLELINRIQKSGYSAEYLILSGYSEFEYVQQAIRFNVKNYILKPPQMKELKEALTIVCNKILAERYMKLRNALENHIFHRYEQESYLTELRNQVYRVYVCVTGPYLEWGIEVMEFHARHFYCEEELLRIKEEQGTESPDVWVLDGYYPNMKLVVALHDTGHGSGLYERLKLRAEETQMYITFVVSSEKSDFKYLRKTVQDCSRFLWKEMKFGISQSLIMPEGNEGSKEKSPGRAEYDAVFQAIETNRPEVILKQYRRFSDEWEEMEYTQMLFLKTTMDFLKEICQKLFHSRNTDIEQDALQQVNLIAFAAGSFREFVHGIEKLIQDVYDSFGKTDSDYNVGNIVEKLWNYINNTYRDSVDVNGFARENGYHPVYLITQFSKLKGISPIKRMIQLRMQTACELLTESEMSLKIISEMVGYSDVSYFSRTFKEHEGVSPSEYRKQAKAESIQII